jgi:hypothetical protein
LLLLMFVTLAIAGPMLHFTERRRRRLSNPFNHRDGRRPLRQTTSFPILTCHWRRPL